MSSSSHSGHSSYAESSIAAIVIWPPLFKGCRALIFACAPGEWGRKKQSWTQWLSEPHLRQFPFLLYSCRICGEVDCARGGWRIDLGCGTRLIEFSRKVFTSIGSLTWYLPLPLPLPEGEYSVVEEDRPANCWTIRTKSEYLRGRFSCWASRLRRVELRPLRNVEILLTSGQSWPQAS
jgi:hypothetical protein